MLPVLVVQVKNSKNVAVNQIDMTETVRVLNTMVVNA